MSATRKSPDILLFLSILAVKEAGIFDRWLDAQITNISQCLRPPTADRSKGIAALDIDALAGSFVMLVGGEDWEETEH